MSVKRVIAPTAGANYTPLPAVGYVYASCQQVGIGAVSAQSAAIASEMIALYATGDCYINIGSNPTASNTNMFLAAGERLHVVITSGQKVAVIQASAVGTLHITPVQMADA